MIYVIKGTHEGKDIYKIGTTGQNPRERLRQIQNNNVSPLQLVAGFIGTRDDEQMFHNAFRKHRLHGEWFLDCIGIRKLVEDFSIDQWDDACEGIGMGEMTLEEAYQKLTLLRFYDRATAEAIAVKEVREKIAELEAKKNTPVKLTESSSRYQYERP